MILFVLFWSYTIIESKEESYGTLGDDGYYDGIVGMVQKSVIISKFN